MEGCAGSARFQAGTLNVSFIRKAPPAIRQGALSISFLPKYRPHYHRSKWIFPASHLSSSSLLSFGYPSAITDIGSTFTGNFSSFAMRFFQSEFITTPHHTAPKPKPWAHSRMFCDTAAQSAYRNSFIPSTFLSPQTIIAQAASASILAFGL